MQLFKNYRDVSDHWHSAPRYYSHSIDFFFSVWDPGPMASFSSSAPLCRACSVAVLSSSCRRNLNGIASANVVAVLMQLNERLGVSGVNFRGKNSFVCRPCFRSIEKLVYLRRTIQEMENKIEVCIIMLT